MKGKEVKFYWKELKEGKEYDEDIAIPPDKDAEAYIKDLLVKFNAEEDHRHKQNPDYKIYYREFIRLEGETGKHREIMVRCVSTKYNTLTITRGDEMYDLYLCKNCKMIRKRPTVEWNEAFCFPERVCTQCNKLFVTVRTLAFHNKRANHRLPDWFPDGV